MENGVTISLAKKVGIVVKQKVLEAQKLADQTVEFLRTQSIETLSGPTDNLIQKCDFIIVLGGDGTFLSVARRMIKRSIPILGVNMGQLGFLTEIKKSELFQKLSRALRGGLQISERALLECTLKRNQKAISKTIVVNDVVISKGAIARIFDMQVSVDKLLVSNIKADGLIVSTPTGSTAYCLAASGPLVEPSVPAMVIVPVCPHSLTLRPLVIRDNSMITVIPQYKSGNVILTLDGQTSYELKSKDEVKITKFKKHTLKIFHTKERDYFSLLREKLKYGYRD